MQTLPRPDYLRMIAPHFGKGLIKILTGVRRVGKSSMLRLLINSLKDQGVNDENILLINKESLEWDHIQTYRDLNDEVIRYFKNAHGRCYAFIDEVQEVEQWERCAASLIADEVCDLTLTGSNAHLLASELATLLSGRYLEFKIYPLTFREFLEFRRSRSVLGGQIDEFQLFLRYGGLPAIHSFDLSDDQVFPYLNSIYSTVILKDVMMRHAVKNPGHLQRIVRFVFDNCGNVTTSKRISDYLKSQKISASVDTVLNYLMYLEEAFLIFKVLRHDIKGMRNLELYEKYYMGDIGLRHGLIGFRDADISGVLENIVYLELIKRGFDVKIGKLDDKEIDFIAVRGGQKIYLQVAYLLQNPETIEREFSVLEHVPDNHEKFVLTLDVHQKVSRGGIKHLNLIGFLLDDTW